MMLRAPSEGYRHPGIRIGALVEQLARQFEAVDLAGHDGWGQAVLNWWTARPGQLVQRGPAGTVGVRIGAALDQL